MEEIEGAEVFGEKFFLECVKQGGVETQEGLFYCRWGELDS